MHDTVISSVATCCLNGGGVVLLFYVILVLDVAAQSFELCLDAVFRACREN